MHLRQGLVACRLAAPVVAQQAAHLPQQDGGVGATAEGVGDVAAEFSGKVEGVHGVDLDRDDVGRASCPRVRI